MKGTAFKDMKAKALSNPEVKHAHKGADHKLELFQLLYNIKMS